MMENKNAKDLTIAFIGGGSRDWARQIMADLALEPALGGRVRLFDIDQEAAENNVRIGERTSALPAAVSKWNYEAPTEIADALTGADFVIISILVGDFDVMESDVHGPEKYGIYQSVGDTAGPGGFFRALRTVPVFQYYAKMIEKYCPKAWVLNYTNPMTMCMTALYRTFPAIKAIGCCHEILGVQETLARIAELEEGIKVDTYEDVKVNVQGINHFTWITSAFINGRDVCPIYDRYMEKHPEGFSHYHDKVAALNRHFQTHNLVKYDLFKRYGALAAAGDRHLAEFVPYGWYMKDPEMVERWGFGLTPVSWRRQYTADRNKIAEEVISGKRPLELKGSGEDAVEIMKALLGLKTFITNANLENKGQLGGIPLGAVVETNAYISCDSIRPVWAGRMKDDILQLTIPHVLNEEETVAAAMTDDMERAKRAFVGNPQLAGLRRDDGEALFLQLYENSRDWNKPYTGRDR